LITLSVHLCVQHAGRDAARREGQSAAAETCYRLTARRNARIASAVLATAIPSVCLSLRLSHAGIVSK